MTIGLFSRPPPELNVSPEERLRLRTAVERRIDEAQTLYESQLGDTDANFACAQWDLLRESDGIRVYQDRRPGAGTDNKDHHVLLTVGSIPGTLHDAMYGELNHSHDDMRIKTAYIKDPSASSAVLATILEPTEEKPFESMTVRWRMKPINFVLRSVLQHQDFVFVEATGMRRLASGEDVGFHLVHSVSSSDIPKLPSFGRTRFTVCTMWRQLSLGRVHVFRTAHADIPESTIVAARLIRAFVQVMLSVQNVIDCAQRKKLTFLVADRAARVKGGKTGSTSDEDCRVCATRLRCPRARAKYRCAVCGQPTCSECHSKITVYVVGSDNGLDQLKIRVCRSCTQFTTQLDAAEVARKELNIAYSSTRNNWLKHRSLIHAESTTSSCSDSESQSLW